MSELTFVDTCASTNDLAREHLARSGSNAWAVCARRQTKGRGRRGRTWTDLGGDQIFLSIALRGAEYRRVVLKLSIAAGVGAADALEAHGASGIHLKWPNDLVDAAGHKVGGILGEAIITDGRVEGAIVGVGINLAAPESWPAELRATSADALGVRGEREAIAASLHRYIVDRCDALTRGDSREVLDAWRTRDANLGKRVRFAEGTKRGVADGIDASGALRVRDTNGVVHFINAGEVRWEVEDGQEGA